MPGRGVPSGSRDQVRTRVLLVDAHRMFTDLLAFAIDAEADLHCVGQAASLAEALACCDELAPDVVVLDKTLPDGDWLEATSRILERRPDTRVLVLTATADEKLLRSAAAVGARGVLVKNSGRADVLRALRGARQGMVIVDISLLSLIAAGRDGDQRPQTALTGREHEVLHLLAQGEDVSAIAQALGIGLPSCRALVRSLRAKLGARTQLEAVVKAVRMGLVPSLRAVESDGRATVPPSPRGAGG